VDIAMLKKCFKLNKSDIAPVQLILEAYEGMVIVSTIDARAATIQVLIMPDFADEVEAIIKDLQGSYDLKEIPSNRHGVFPC
jgi:hypothetical protein